MSDGVGVSFFFWVSDGVGLIVCVCVCHMGWD